MENIKASFPVKDQEQCEVLMALLTDIGYDGFEEVPGELLAYIDRDHFNNKDLEDIATSAGVTYSTESIAHQNWNAVWESNFQPVVVEDFCTVRAGFHDIQVDTPYEIVITPKMSFGTGHHATTQLMMLLMKDVDFSGRSVLDFGTGTGILAILAEMLGATDVLAIDNDTWCVENAVENIARNSCKHVSVRQGSLEVAETGSYDVILANINRHILLQYISGLYQILKPGGVILMSGLLADDREGIINAAVAEGFKFFNIREQANWIAIHFVKP